MINLLRQVYFFRDVAQLASAPRSGRGGRPFESDHPDIFSKECSLLQTTYYRTAFQTIRLRGCSVYAQLYVRNAAT